MGRSVYVAQKRSSSELQVWFLFMFHRFYCQLVSQLVSSQVAQVVSQTP